MDRLIDTVRQKQNVILTGMQGLERSRFLLKSELNLLVSTPDRSFKVIYHILSSNRLAEKVYSQAMLMPFEEFNVGVSKELEGLDANGSVLYGEQPTLVICNLKYVIEKYCERRLLETDVMSVFVFDGITLENLEGSFCDAVSANNQNPNGLTLPSMAFTELRKHTIVLACNLPLDGLEAELDCKFDVVIDALSLSRPCFNVKSQIIPRDPSDRPYKFGGLNHNYDGDAGDKQRLYEETGKILKSLTNNNQTKGGVVIFFPSYGRMVEYHNAWKQSGVFAALGLDVDREYRGEIKFKSTLTKFADRERFVLLCSIRYHQDEDLAEFVLAQAGTVIVVGLPYPFMNDTWESRIRYNNEHRGVGDRLDGESLHKFRAIEFLNGIIKRCLNEYRFRNMNIVILDEALENHRDKLAAELGDVEVSKVVSE